MVDKKLLFTFNSSWIIHSQIVYITGKRVKSLMRSVKDEYLNNSYVAITFSYTFVLTFNFHSVSQSVFFFFWHQLCSMHHMSVSCTFTYFQ